MVVFPSWLPFFLPQSSREDKTQRTQSPQDAKNARSAIRNDKRRNARKKNETVIYIYFNFISWVNFGIR